MPLQKITKKELIRNSVQVFRQKGYYRTSMSDLAKACGLTKGAFYHHFSNKEEVMLTSLKATVNWFSQHVFSIAYAEDIANEDKLTEMSKVMIVAFGEEAGGCFFANTILETAQVEDTFKTVVKDFFKLWEQALIHVFSAKYALEKAEEISVRSIMEIEGAIVLMQLHDDINFLQSAINRCVSRY